MIPIGSRVVHKSNEMCGTGLVSKYREEYDRYEVEWEHPFHMCNKTHSKGQLIVIGRGNPQMTTRIHPLHDINEMADWMRINNEYYPVERHTGRSTIQALRYIAEAMENPYKEIQISDHYKSSEANLMLLERIKDIVILAELDHFTFRPYNYSLTFGEK